MLVCGFNRFSQLDKTSTNKDSNGHPIIDQPCKFHVDPSLLSSFSMNYGQTVWITHDGKTYARGDNIDGRICGSLPKRRLLEDTLLFLKDLQEQPFKFISVVCGYEYTLYLVSPESSSTDFKLVYCFSDKTPNPLFVNIGNRTPRALFGGYSTSGVIDTEGGIIILTESIFESPTKKVEASFLPGNDKAVKLACCNNFVIALGMSGRVYESEVTSTIKFEEVKELSYSTAVDISGTFDFCFVVLKDGRVYGRGNNSESQLGVYTSNDEGDKKFILISSLINYKIVSVFTGTYHSIFKTSKNKMIACGSNIRGQLFTSCKNKTRISSPEKIKMCKGFNFCVTGSYSSAAFFNIEMPPNFANRKIERDVTKVETKDESLERELRKEIEELKKKLREKEEENLKLATQNKEYDDKYSELKEELMQLKKNMKENPDNSQQKPSMKEFQILDVDAIKGLENIEEISSNNNGKIMKVAKKVIYALKMMKNKDITHKQIQHFVAEYEIMNALNHPNILKSYGIFYGNEEIPASILLEYCPDNLDKAIKNKTLSKVDRVCSIYEIASGMKFVHFNHIIHRDIKPSNILISIDGHIKVSDFGISKLVSSEDESMTSGIGTQKFMAPEIINEEEYNEKVDIYSFGVLIYFIISNGKMPKITITQVGTGKKAEIPSDFTDFAHELIDSCWNFNPEDRPSFESICSQLKDNAYQLFDLTQSEIKDVQIFIENHQKMIPNY